jgi:Kef-type K+ transport system membrane component KefB
MTLPGPEMAAVLAVLGLLVIAAHVMGHVFTLARQPRVVGEIVGGMLLGPTVLGALLPGWQAVLFTGSTAGTTVVSWCSQLGLLLLMFCSGAQMRTSFGHGEGRLVGLVTVTGVTIPFAAGLLVVIAVGPGGLVGAAGNTTALTLVFGLAVAVTSIPVISRIMVDLGIIETSFARVVLGIAVLEDVVVYVVLALALGLVTTPEREGFGVPALLGLQSGSGTTLTFHVVATLAFLAAMVLLGPVAYRWLRHSGWNLLAISSPVAFDMVFLFAACLVALALGITPMFGAFLAGIAATRSARAETRHEGDEAPMAAIRTFSFAFFVPVYFAAVGVQLDLLHGFDPLFFAWFLVFACAVKSASAYAGARLAGEPARGSRHIALATNARGGPGIVLASVSFGAGIVSEKFFTSLVLLAIVTSLVTGSWLGRIVRSGQPLRDEPAAPRARRLTPSHAFGVRPPANSEGVPPPALP